MRRRAVRAGAVQQILRHLEAPESRCDLENLQLTDPTLATLIGLEAEWHSLWRCPPSTAVRGSLLWETARRSLHHCGRRYQAQSITPRALTVGPERLAKYQQQHIPASTPDDTTSKRA